MRTRGPRTLWTWLGVGLIVLGVGMALVNHAAFAGRGGGSQREAAAGDDGPRRERDRAIRIYLRDGMSLLVIAGGVAMIIIERRRQRQS